MSTPIYALDVLLEAERRQNAAMEAHFKERERTIARTLRVHRLRRTLRMWEAYRMIGEAMDLVAANLYRGRPRRISALLVFEKQWSRERRWLRRHGLKMSGLDAIEQFVRCIRMWRVAGVFA